MHSKKKSGKKDVKKYKLKGTMKQKTIVQTNTNEYSILMWFVKDYAKLRESVLYVQMYENKNFQCVFKLIKSKNYLNLALRLCYTNADVLFYLDNGPASASKSLPATEISKGFYVERFSHDMVFHKEGHFGRGNILKLVCRFITDCKVDRQNYPPGEVGVISDVDQFGSVIKLLYLTSCDTDFVLNVGDVSIKVHKCVLVARSRFFEEYLRKYKEAKEFPVPDTSPGIMHEVLVYMYSGQLSKMDVRCMIKVYELAYLLKIPSLKDACSRFFEKTHSWRILRRTNFSEYAIE